MKIKFKINENTTLKDIESHLEVLSRLNINELELNLLRKIIQFLGANEVTSTGSSVRFYHPVLQSDPMYHGYFQIHKIHKGGNQDLVRMVDFKRYLYPALVKIIKLTEI